MDAVSLVLGVVGAFYVFAGLVATRAGLTSALLDRALAAITMKPTPPVEAAQSAWLIASANLVLAGGVALLARLDVAAWLFVVSAFGQLVYLLLLSPFVFDVEDPPDESGRRQTRTAAIIYMLATALVLWAAASGRLMPWRDAPLWLLVAAGCAVVAHVAYTLLRLRPVARAPGVEDDAGAE